MGSKVCRKCGTNKPILEFYAHAQMLDGHLNICKSCVKLRVRKHRFSHDHVREYDKRRYQDDPKRKRKMSENAKLWRIKNPDGYRAHYLVSNAIRDGRLKKMPCEICGDPKGHAHHEDYSKPLEVSWLCPTHHQRHHHADV